MKISIRALAWAILVLLSAAGACGGGTPRAGAAGGGGAGQPGSAGTFGAAGSGAGSAGASSAAGSSGSAGSARAPGTGAVAGHGSPDGGGLDAAGGGMASDVGPARDGASTEGGHPADTASADGAAPTNVFVDPFDSFQTSIWSCEYSCPQAANGTARFTLKAGAAPDTTNSWSKIRYKPRRFTTGRFTVRFALTARPPQAVWWGVALWDDGPAADGSQFNEINVGYTTDESFTNTELRFESSKRGKGVSLKVDTGVDLYDGQLHTGTLEYDATHVSFLFDGKLLQTITDTSVIPTDPVDFIIGPRLVTGSPALAADFVEIADSTDISW